MRAFDRCLLQRGLWLLVLAAGCDAASSRDGGLAEELRDREFLATDVEGHTLVPGTEIRLRFRDDGELSAYAGCNHMSGSFTIEGDVLRIHGLSSTQIGCDPALHEQDQWLQELLTGSPTLRFDDPELTIEGDGGTLTLVDREVASPDRPLVGTHWVGNGMGDEQAITFGPGSALVTAHFDEDGSVSVFTACQDGAGTYRADEVTIEIDELGYDDVVCDDPALESVASQVRFVLASGATIAFEIEEANLTLERDGKLLLFREAE